MKKTKTDSERRTKIVALGLFLIGIVVLWVVFTKQSIPRALESFLKTSKNAFIRYDVVSEMKARNPEYVVIDEPLVFELSSEGFSETYSTDLFSVTYPENTLAYNANTSELAGFGFCPGGKADCQYPRMVIIPMKTTSLEEWLAEDAGYHQKAYWNYPANEGKYAVTVQSLRLGEYPGVILDVHCTEGSECASPDAKMGAFVAQNRVFIFQHEQDTGPYEEMLQSFTLLEQ